MLASGSPRVRLRHGMGIQGYAIWAALSRSLIWPIRWPSGVVLYATLLIYYVGFCIQNATCTVRRLPHSEVIGWVLRRQ